MSAGICLSLTSTPLAVDGAKYVETVGLLKSVTKETVLSINPRN